jgi:hypothetical protein
VPPQAGKRQGRAGKVTDWKALEGLRVSTEAGHSRRAEATKGYGVPRQRNGPLRAVRSTRT